MREDEAAQEQAKDHMEIEVEEPPVEVSPTYHADVAQLQKRHGQLLTTQSPSNVADDAEIDLRIDTRALQAVQPPDQQQAPSAVPMPSFASSWYAAPPISPTELCAARITRECNVWAARASKFDMWKKKIPERERGS